MGIGLLATVVLIAAGVIAGCSSISPTASAPSSEPPKPVLHGTYLVTIEGNRTLRDGGPSPEPSATLRWAFRSSCAERVGDRGQSSDVCIAVAVPVNDENPPKTGEPAVWDQVDGAWVKTVTGQLACFGVPAPTLETWSLRPGADDTLTGIRHLAFFGVGCGSVLEQFVTVRRTADIDSAVMIPDPATQAPLKSSAGAGLWGRYNKIQTQVGQPPIPVIALAVTTNCIRNTEHCLTYTVYEPPEKPRRVSGYKLLDGLWSSAVPYNVTCPDGSAVRITVETGWPLPERANDPIPRLVGIQRDVYAEPCAKTVESQLVLERIGD